MLSTIIVCVLSLTAGAYAGNNAVNKRSHSQGSSLTDHCWDSSGNHVLDPFCALLTATTPMTTTTTTEPTTTTTEPTTTTTEPTTTTTTEPTTTTTEPTTTTTTLPPPTTARQCSYDVLNGTDIKSTDLGMDTTLIQNTNITFNESVHLIGEISFCEGVCTKSLLNGGIECRGFTYNPIDSCFLYYYFRPLYMVETIQQSNSTTLYLKRCTNDPPTTPKLTTSVSNFTEAFASTAQTEIIKVSNSPSNATSTISSGIHHTSTAQTKPPITHHTSTAQTKPPITHIIGGKSTQHTATPTGIHHVMTTIGGEGTTFTRATNEVDSKSPASHITILSSTSFKVVGKNSPTQDKCFFLDQTFKKGDHWKQDCRYDCECIDPVINAAVCIDICPHYTNLPAVCQLINVTGQCCPKLDCGNHTEFNNNTYGDGGNITEGCHNVFDKCDYYEDNACSGVYESWARANCALRCGYCDYKEPCFDRLTYCFMYDLDYACQDYRGWARHNCKQSCAMCR